MDLERKHLRLPVETRVFIELEAPASGSDAPGHIATCKTLDVSANGLQVALEHELIEQTYLQIGIEPPQVGDAASEPFFLAAQVRWCRAGETADQPWLAGLALLPAGHSDIGRWIDLISGLE
ncbi:PilZ domain-containing protein [Seongchinamella sediminis]|uniref:PilZ domain-containing protein n=1 Tax=Seongchinamella sediminis TaxID=2283635 RepID=A0A3L7DVK1_9GAMM|nr:PilZ domain-containing protein [Seongchinamella sediminis]RLQ20815.1 PilZ domain-containing protein [Seongchinamella sediminis]